MLEDWVGSMSHPVISVVVPLYNHERYIAAALESVLCQSEPAAEIIVIDDGSTDGSTAVAQRYAERNPQIRLSRHPNQGAHSAINTGVDMAGGEYVAILNSDDVYTPDRLRECAAVLTASKEIAAVASALEFVDDNGGAMRYTWYEQARDFYREVGDLGLALANGNFIMTTSNLMVRRSVFAEVGRFLGLRYAHDLDFLLRLITAGKSIHVLEGAQLYYRLHAANTIKEDHRNVRAEWASAVSCFARNLFARRQPMQETWEYYRSLLKIAERHQLTPMIFMFFAFLETLPPGEANSEAFLHYPEFRRQIMEIA